jgi:uncharacterized protein YoxC
MVLRWNSIGFAATILVIAGCKGQQTTMGERGQAPATPTAPPAAEMPAAPTTTAMPAAIEHAEDLSEEVQSDIAKGKWDDVTKKTTHLQALSDSLKMAGASPADLTAYDTAVSTLAKDVASQNQLGAAMAANEANRATYSMMASHSPKVPVQVGYMEVDARGAVYHAMGGDWSGAEKAVSDLSTNYSAVQAHVAQKDASLDQKLRTEIEGLSTAVSQKNVEAVNEAAKKVTDDLHKVEKQY